MPAIDVLLNGYNMSTSEGSLGFCTVTLVRGERTYLVDVAQPGRRRNLLDALTAAGLRPGDIDAVVLTHSHWDHILNIDLFPDAEILLHRLELEYVRDPLPGDWATPLYTRQLLEDKRIRTVEDGEQLEAGLSVLLTPGHTRGSMTLLVETGQGVAGIAGDAAPTAQAYLDGVPTLIMWSEQEARASVRAIAARAGIIYPGHDRPFRIMEGGVEYLRPLNITVTTLVETGSDLAALEVDSTRAEKPVTLGSAPPRQPTVWERPVWERPR